MIESSKVPAGVMKITSAGMPSTINRRRPSRARMSFCAHLRPPTSVFTPHRFHYRAVITLYDVYGWSMAGVAACLGITPSTAKARAHRARLLLRQRLGEFMPRRTIYGRSGLLRSMRSRSVAGPPTSLMRADALVRITSAKARATGRRWPFNGCWRSSGSAVLATASCQSRRDWL